MAEINQGSIKEKKWYSKDADACMVALNTSIENGLSEEEVRSRLDEFGRNTLPESKKRSALMRFFAQFHNVLIYLLLAAAVITALMDHWIDTWVILAVVLVNTLIGFIQEGKAEQALESIRKMLSLEALVLRNGNRQVINAEELVPGDIIILRSGDKVPADARIVKSKNFRIEESPLTGESKDVRKHIEPVSDDAVIGDRKSMVFSGTLVTYGEATGIVVATGQDTELGKIKQMLEEVEQITTPLMQKIDRFGKILSIFIVVVATAFFAFGHYFRDYTMVELFMATISLVVASIPEGLPAIMTITLAIGVQRMARRNAIIRRLPSVETLGSVEVICTDKTGTLTRDEMTAKTIITAEQRFEVEGSGYKPEGKIYKDGNKKNVGIDLQDERVLQIFLQCIRACNDSDLKETDEGEWKVEGTSTEGALLTLAYKAGLGEFKPQRIDSIPFESDNKYMATLHKHDGNTYIYVKGAPERLLEMCSQQLTEAGEQKLDLKYWEEQMSLIAGQGERLMAAAYSKLNAPADQISEDDLKNVDLYFLGLVGIIDPPREEAYAAIEECKEAGIRVIMITGDHAITAKAIADELGIGRDKDVITGTEIEKMDDEQLQDVVMQHDVFARTDPAHKLRLVQALQANNISCAMTGDGVNDAPALKRANIGIAMGIKGTEVSKDAAEIILTDDNFASIVNAVEEGRTVYDNIKKTILFILPTNGAEALIIMGAVLVGTTLPITPVQLLWINMVTAVTLALSLSMEPMEKKVMQMPPRQADEPIIGRYFLWRIAFVSILVAGLTGAGYWFFSSGGDHALATNRTIAVNILVAAQLFYLFNCKKINETSLSGELMNNKYVFIAIAALAVLQLGFTYAPFMNNLFGTAPLAAGDWIMPLGIGLLVFFIVEGEKFITRKIA